jgi:glucose/arabinose dehydrogenase
MNMRTRTLVVGIVIIVLGIAGYMVYTHLKQKPPRALIEALTKTDPPPPLPAGDIAPLSVPEGFSATIFSRDVADARVLVRDPKGTLVASLTKSGKIVALPDADNDEKSDRTMTILENLKEPHGLLFDCDAGSAATNSPCILYVAETGELKSYEYDPETFTATYKETLATFPTGDGHFTRTLLMHPDKKHLFISIGSSCNVCTEEDGRRATIQILDLETKEMTPYATGLRNSVFMQFDPVNGELWATDNGRDVIGDDIPPDEINIIEQGKNYGWPVCYGDRVHDTDFDKKREDPCTETVPPHIALQAHSAALGLAFIPQEGWPEDMQNDLLVAYHGSWNRSQPTGYKVVRFDLDSSRNASSGPIDFLTGFISPTTTEEGDAIGRPVGILTEPGRAYISDDRAGAIYLVRPTPSV